MNRRAVVQDMKVRILKIDDFFSSWIFDPGLSDIPFLRNGPIENPGAAGNFVNVKRNMFLQERHCFTHALTGDTSADRKQVSNQPIHLLAHARCIVI